MREPSFTEIAEAADRAFRHNQLPNGVITPNKPYFTGSFLWDTALIAQGLACVNPLAASEQIELHMLGQHENGMIPNEVIHAAKIPLKPKYLLRYEQQGENVFTSNITQPPILVTAAWHVAERMRIAGEDSKAFLKSIFPPLHRYMSWLLLKRSDPADGLVMLIHPNESGMDNTPSWRAVMEREWSTDNQTPFERLIAFAGHAAMRRINRTTTGFNESDSVERADDDDIMLGYLQSRHIQTNDHDVRRILDSGKGAVVKDVGFNAITAEAGKALISMEVALTDNKHMVSNALHGALEKLYFGIEIGLWQHDKNGYYSIDARTGSAVEIETAANLLPLLTTGFPNRRDSLADNLTDPDRYWTALPVASVCKDSSFFESGRYWRGSSWPFLRSIFHRALLQQGYIDAAQQLRQRTLRNPYLQHFGEFNDALTGKALGKMPFSPAAAEALLYADYERREVHLSTD